MKSMLVALLGLLPAAAASPVTVTGYIVDQYCWDRPHHRGIDGAYLGTAPETHVLHCLWVRVCISEGYVVLEQLSVAASDGSTYGIKYTLDDAGDAMVIDLAQRERILGGDRQFDEQWTVTGEQVGNEIQVTSLCVTSLCSYADTDAPSLAPTNALPSPAPTTAPSSAPTTDAPTNTGDTPAPSSSPTSAPSSSPTSAPTTVPSDAPVYAPVAAPISSAAGVVVAELPSMTVTIMGAEQVAVVSHTGPSPRWLGFGLANPETDDPMLGSRAVIFQPELPGVCAGGSVSLITDMSYSEPSQKSKAAAPSAARGVVSCTAGTEGSSFTLTLDPSMFLLGTEDSTSPFYLPNLLPQSDPAFMAGAVSIIASHGYGTTFQFHEKAKKFRVEDLANAVMVGPSSTTAPAGPSSTTAPETSGGQKSRAFLGLSVALGALIAR